MIDDLGVGGMFTSSLDADADGREGLTYVWTPAQLREVLVTTNGRWAAELFNVTDNGTFEHGKFGAADVEDRDASTVPSAALMAGTFHAWTQPGSAGLSAGGTCLASTRRRHERASSGHNNSAPELPFRRCRCPSH